MFAVGLIVCYTPHMVGESETRGLLPQEPLEVQQWYSREYARGLRLEYSSGDRFVVLFQFDAKSQGVRGTHQAYIPNPSMTVSSVDNPLPPQEVPTIPVPVQLREVVKALVFDKQAHQGLNLAELLPEGYKVRIADMDDRLKARYRSMGMDVESADVKRLFSRGMPVTTFATPPVVDVPIFRFYQDTPWKRDAFAEQLVYTVGQARAISQGTTGYMPVDSHAREYIRTTLGGNLLLLGAEPQGNSH